jgi:hypothetical protein
MLVKWRITTICGKVVYVVVGYVAIALFFWALRSWLLDPRGWAYAAIALIVNLAFTLVGVRAFRGFMEPAEPPRPLWRWTGRPRAGFWLGALYLISALVTIRGFWPDHGRPPEIVMTILNLLESALLGIGYLRSSLTLRPLEILWSKRRRDARQELKPRSST